MENKMKKPIVTIKSSGPEGNIYWILAAAREALKKQHRIIDYNNLYEAVTTSKSYADALVEVRKYVDLIDSDGLI